MRSKWNCSPPVFIRPGVRRSPATHHHDVNDPLLLAPQKERTSNPSLGAQGLGRAGFRPTKLPCNRPSPTSTAYPTSLKLYDRPLPSPRLTRTVVIDRNPSSKWARLRPPHANDPHVQNSSPNCSCHLKRWHTPIFSQVLQQCACSRLPLLSSSDFITV